MDFMHNQWFLTSENFKNGQTRDWFGPHLDTIGTLNSEVIDKADRPCKSSYIVENYFVCKLDDNVLVIFVAEIHWVSKQKIHLRKSSISYFDPNPGRHSQQAAGWTLDCSWLPLTSYGLWNWFNFCSVIIISCHTITNRHLEISHPWVA